MKTNSAIEHLNDNFSDVLLKFYVRGFVVILPAIVIYQVCGLLKWIILDSFQIAMGVIALLVGSWVLLFKKKAVVRRTIVPLHFCFVAAQTIISFSWAIVRPDANSAFGLLLMIFICGLIIVKPIATMIYFAMVTILVLIFGLTADNEFLDLRYAFYLMFCGILITIFSFWREQLSQRNQETANSYRNIFSDLAEQIFVLDENLVILEANKTAMDQLGDQFKNGLAGLIFNEVFCSQNQEDKKRFNDNATEAWMGRKKTFEAQCSIVGSENYKQKEFTLRKSHYFNREVLIVTIRSTQEQKEFESRLIESKENISRVLENINSFVFNISYHPQGDHQVNYVSNKVKEVYGIEADEYITLVKSGRLSDIFYHGDRQDAVRCFEEVLTTCRQNRIKFRIVRNGEIRWVEEKIFPEKDEVSGTIHLFGIVTDITDQIGAIESLELSEKRYRQIFERNLAGVYKTHVDGTIIDANMAFAKIVGFDSVEELKKINIRDLYYEKSDRKEYLDRLRNEGFINNHISVLRRRDGKRIVLNNNVSIQPDEDGNPNIIEGTLIDMTETEETANALRLSEEKYRLLFEESTEGILLISLSKNEARIFDFNPGAANLLGYNKSQLSGMSVDKIVHNSLELKKLLAEKTPANMRIESEWIFTRSDGHDFVAEVSSVPIQLGDDKIIQLVFKDISERKRNEEILLESQRSFKNIVDNSPAAILIFSDQQLVYCNSLGEQIYNEKLNNLSKNIFGIFPEKLRFILSDLINEKSAGENSFTEIELPGENEIRKYSLNAVKTMYNNKKSDLLLIQDITLQTEYNRQKLRAEIAEDANKKLQDEIASHKETQAQLLEKTFWLNALFESSYNLFILSLDEQFRVSSFNENFKRMIDRSLGIEVKVGDVFLDIFNPGQLARQKIEERFRRVLKGETLEFISHFESRRGEVWVESFLNPVKIGDREVSEISFISHEITEKIESQRKIKESESNNRAILLALPDIITKVSKEGFFVDFRMSQAHGLDPILPHLKTAHFVGNRVVDVIKNPEIAGKFLEIIATVLDTNELVTHTFELKPANGSRPLYYENRFSKMNDNEVIVLARNVTETIEYEAMLVESVREKEVLLKEVHHRVKNNLQVINSILNLQSSYVEDPKTLEIINESQNRIRSMSYIHESLYQTKDFSSINFAEYITNLVQNLVHSYQLYEDKIDLQLNVGSVELALDQAIPCGLILNELVSNALKYAYPGEKKGRIVIEVLEENNKIHLGVEDFGVGLPEGYKIEQSESLGLSLVYTLVDQLDGQLNLKRLGGTKFLITFEKQEV